MLTKELQIVERVLSETNLGGTGCGKAARPDLWGSGEVTTRSTRTIDGYILSKKAPNKYSKRILYIPFPCSSGQDHFLRVHLARILAETINIRYIKDLPDKHAYKIMGPENSRIESL